MWIRRHGARRATPSRCGGSRSRPGPCAARGISRRSGSRSPDSTRFAHRTSRHCAKAFDDALAALAPSDRLFAALYYAEQLDRSQMAHLQRVPEITISRRLADIRLELHTAISGILASTIASARAQEKDGVARALTPAQIERCFTYACEDWQSEIPRRDKKSGGKESSTEREEVFDWLLANSLKRRAANISVSNAPGCPEAELLSAYADRALDPDETVRWELHFADCVRCRAILAAYLAPAK